jgi:hypothetical protein
MQTTIQKAKQPMNRIAPPRAEALVKDGLMDEANVEAATAALENEGDKEAEDYPAGFDDALENAGHFLDLRA